MVDHGREAVLCSGETDGRGERERKFVVPVSGVHAYREEPIYVSRKILLSDEEHCRKLRKANDHEEHSVTYRARR